MMMAAGQIRQYLKYEYLPLQSITSGRRWSGYVTVLGLDRVVVADATSNLATKGLLVPDSTQFDGQSAE